MLSAVVYHYPRRRKIAEIGFSSPHRYDRKTFHQEPGNQFILGSKGEGHEAQKTVPAWFFALSWMLSSIFERHATVRHDIELMTTTTTMTQYNTSPPWTTTFPCVLWHDWLGNRTGISPQRFSSWTNRGNDQRLAEKQPWTWVADYTYHVVDGRDVGQVLGE